MNSPDAGIGIQPEVTKTRFENLKQVGSEKIKKVTVGANEVRNKISSFFARDKSANPDTVLRDIAGVPSQESVAQQAQRTEAAATVTLKNNESMQTMDKAVSESQAKEVVSPKTDASQLEELGNSRNENSSTTNVNREQTSTPQATEISSIPQVPEDAETTEADTQENATEAALMEVIQTGHDIQSLQGVLRVLHHAKDPATLIGVGSIAVSLLATRFNTPIPPGVIERAAGAIGGAAAGWSFGKNQEKMIKLRNAAIGSLLTTVGMEGLHNAPGEVTHKLAKGIGTVDDFFGIASTLLKNKIPGLRRTPSTIPVPEPAG